MALGHCGINTPIDDVDTENSNEAAACLMYYDLVRGLLLEMRAWPFATTQETLQLMGTTTAEWTYRYKYPSNCVRIDRIVNPYTRTESTVEQKIPYKVVDADQASEYGKAILTDQQLAVIEFNQNITDETLFSFTYVQAFALMLASFIATPLTVSSGLKEGIAKQFEIWKNEASVNASTERRDDPEREAGAVLART